MEKVNLHIDNYDAVEDAIMNCLQDMYAIAQPPLDFKAHLAAAKKDPELRKISIYDKHYLPQKVHDELMDSYIHRYHLEDMWKWHADLCIDYLKDGGTKDKYIDDWTDERGNWHPGYRGYEKVPPLKEVLGEELTDLVLKRLDWCKNFYVGNRYECQFRFNVCDVSPTCNPKTVLEYEHSIGHTDFTIDENFDPWADEYDDYMDNDVVDEDIGAEIEAISGGSEEKTEE